MMFRRIGLFLLVNFLVIITISLLLSILGIGHFITEQGLDFRALMMFCLVWGMGGSFISLALSKKMAVWMMGVKIIDPKTTDPTQRALVKTVHALAQKAHLPAMPEVGVYSSPEVNAFATGRSKRSSLVAVSSGLLQRMNNDEVEGVIGHELAHIANGDMVTMALLQGIINAFVMFAARAIAYIIMRGQRGRPSPFMYFGLVMVLQMVFMVLGSLIVAWFSRIREFRADAGSAHIAGKQKMIAALQGLERTFNVRDKQHEQAAFQAFKISSHNGFIRFFSSHPPLKERIERLERMR